MSRQSDAYELLAKQIYETLLKAEGFHDAIVQHNIKMKGRSGCEHQIDVYWEFVVANVRFRTAIECKHFSAPVQIGWIRNFYGVLQDIGDVKGIFLTSTGYQSGAKQYADSVHIDLYEMRPPDDDDWKGRIQKILVRLHFQGVNATQCNFLWDTEWRRAHYPEGPLLDIRVAPTDVKIIDGQNNPIGSVHDLLKGLPIPSDGPKTNLVHTFRWEDAYVVAPDGRSFKLLGLEVAYEIVEEMREIVIDGEGTAKAILKDVKTGKIKFFDRDGNVRDFPPLGDPPANPT